MRTQGVNKDNRKDSGNYAAGKVGLTQSGRAHPERYALQVEDWVPRVHVPSLNRTRTKSGDVLHSFRTDFPNLQSRLSPDPTMWRGVPTSSECGAGVRPSSRMMGHGRKHEGRTSSGAAR